MMTSKKERIRNISIVFLLYLVARMCRFPLFNVSTIPYVGAVCGLLRPLIYIGICAAWSVWVSDSIINKRLRSYLQAIAFFCILWMFFRTIKYELTFRGDSVNTFLMYAYYVPFILLPTVGFFASLHARRGERYSIPRPVHVVVSSISLVAIFFVFTNPLHLLFWKHTPEPYTQNIGFAFVIGWLALLLGMTVVNIVVRAKIPGKRTAAMPPLVVLGIIIGYFIMHKFFGDIWKYVSSDWTSFTCLASIGLMHACIWSGMLPSNKGYDKLFKASTKGVIITDDDWNICYASAGAQILPKEILQKTEVGTFEKDKNTLLKSRKLHPGHVVWKEDISAISAVLEELEKNKNELTAKNELDIESYKMELKLSKVQEKNRLYDLSQMATAKQNKKLKETLSKYFEEGGAENKKDLLVRASVLGAYIKRKGNLIFSGDNGTIRASELRLCFVETINNIELLEIDCYMDYSLHEDIEMSVEAAFCFYDSFEKAVEAILPDIDAVFVRIYEEDSNIKAIYKFVSSQNLYAEAFPKEVYLEKDDDTWNIFIAIPRGGVA